MRLFENSNGIVRNRIPRFLASFLSLSSYNNQQHRYRPQLLLILLQLQQYSSHLYSILMITKFDYLLWLTSSRHPDKTVHVLPCTILTGHLSSHLYPVSLEIMENVQKLQSPNLLRFNKAIYKPTLLQKIFNPPMPSIPFLNKP